jgi:hypothetical protein
MKALQQWLRLWPVWAVPMVILGLNVGWLASMRSSIVGRGATLADKVLKTTDECSKLEAQLATLKATRAELDRLQSELGELRSKRLSGMKERLVPFITEVVKLAGDAGVQPEHVGYSAQREEKSGLVLFTASYSIKGTYDQIRRLTFLLEGSNQFILLGGLSLQGDDTASSMTISVSLQMATYFADMDRQLMKDLGVQEVAATPQEQPAPAKPGHAEGADGI